MPVTRWTFVDPTDSTTYTFAINPATGGSPQYEKTISTENTTAPGGNVLLFEGADVPKTGTISGTILSLAHYQAMVTWYQKRHPVVMTDDLGRSLTIYIKKFSPERKRAVSHRYYHGFSMDYVVLSGSDL